MTSKVEQDEVVQPSLRAAFEGELARREAERREREAREQRQQEEDLLRAEALNDILVADTAFLAQHGLTVEWRRFTVSVDRADTRISAYFQVGGITIIAIAKPSALAGDAAPRRQSSVKTVPEAVQVIAAYLADEIH